MCNTEDNAEVQKLKGRLLEDYRLWQVHTQIALMGKAF